MSEVYQKYCNYLNSCVDQIMTTSQKNDYYEIKKQVIATVVNENSPSVKKYWSLTDYHANMNCQKIPDSDEFDGTGQLLVVLDEFFCFHNQGLSSLESIVENIASKNFQYIVTSMTDYKNQPSYLKDFSLPNKINGYWFLEREIARKETYSEWVIETNYHSSIKFDRSQVFFKQLATSFRHHGYEIKMPKNVAYKSVVRRNFESLFFIQKIS